MAIYNRLTRRQMLVGAGGFVLGLPVLPSLLERRALAGPVTPGKNFVALWNSHGGIDGANMYPPDPVNPSTATYPVLGHPIRSSPLPWAAQSSASTASISPVVTGPLTGSTSSPAALTQALAAKMNVIRGLDAGVPLGHNRSGMLGNYAGPFCVATDTSIVTIDQIMAYSKSFTSQGSTVLPFINYGGPNGGCSYGWSNPSTQSGTVQLSENYDSTLTWFQKIFGTGSAGSGPAPISIVDKVYQDYQRLQNHRRLSSYDKTVLNDHVAMIKQLENRLAAQANAAAQCGKESPIDSSTYIQQHSSDFMTNTTEQTQALLLQNELLVAAMVCGACRIGINAFPDDGDNTIHGTFVPVNEPEAQNSTDWHHGVAHCHMYTGPQEQLLASYAANFYVMLDLISRMDQVMVAPGLTLLDNSLVFWSMECGAYTHQSQSWPVVMAGSAGGALKTGLYLDYRDMTPNGIVISGVGTQVGDVLRSGVPYNHWLGTCLQAMGLSPSEYETPGIGGYGQIEHTAVGSAPPASGAFAQSVYTSATAHGLLPFMAA
jgi:hypothetical protein